MNIGQIAALTGLTVKAIRYYESKALISPPERKINGYRYYNSQHLEQLILLRNAKQFGFCLEECRVLIDLLHNPNRKSKDVKREAKKKLVNIEENILKLTQLKNKLATLIAHCPDNDEACCPIINELTERNN